MSSLIRAAFQSATKPCPHCGRWTFANRFTAVTDEVAALLGVQPDAEVAEDCRDRAEQELDAAAAELALDDDAAFLRHHLQDGAGFALIAAGENHDVVALFDLQFNGHIFLPFPLRALQARAR